MLCGKPTERATGIGPPGQVIREAKSLVAGIGGCG